MLSPGREEQAGQSMAWGGPQHKRLLQEGPWRLQPLVHTQALWPGRGWSQVPLPQDRQQGYGSSPSVLCPGPDRAGLTMYKHSERVSEEPGMSPRQRASGCSSESDMRVFLVQ